MTADSHPTHQDAPRFSIIVPTRDRLQDLLRAVDSVCGQHLSRPEDLEVIVVDDGSVASVAAVLRRLPERDPRVRLVSLPRRPRGHGPAYARNAGAAVARAPWLGFLDDDDVWCDAGHLARALRALATPGLPVDLYFTHQRAVQPDGRTVADGLWLAGLAALSAARPDADGTRPVSVDELLAAPGFAHLNCSLYRRSLFDAIRGMDESLRYENDRDVWFRAIDAARGILFNPAVVARHHVPDPARRANASTQVTPHERLLFQLHLLDKAITGAVHPTIRLHATRAKGYTLGRLAESLAGAGQPADARLYRLESRFIALALRWKAWTRSLSVDGWRRPVLGRAGGAAGLSV